MRCKRTGNGWFELVRTAPQARAHKPPLASSTTPKPVIKEPGSIPKTRMLSSKRSSPLGTLALTLSWREGGWCPAILMFSGSQSRHDLFGNVKIGMCFAHVVLVVQGFHQAQHLLGLLALHGDCVLRQHRHFSHVERQPFLFEDTAHLLERLRSGDNFVHLRLGSDVISPGFEDDFEQRVFID